MGSIEQQSLKKKSHISFHVNGKLQTIKDEYPLNATLGYYLRDVLKLTGTKVYCSEGGCGVCAVNATITDNNNNKTKTFSVNSCLFPLYSCDGYSFTTVEGIGNKKSLNPIQKRLADNNASQCGYCTPGFVISMYTLLKNNPKPSKQEIERSFDGNICRCTGYRAILESMKSFAADEKPIGDIEDLLVNMKCLSTEHNHCHDSTSEYSCDIIRDAKSSWHAPTTLPELISTVKRANDTDRKFKLIGGNTSVGIYKTQETVVNEFINVRNVQELNRVEKSSDKLTIGSALSISELIRTFETVSEEDPNNFGHLKQSAESLKRVGSGHIRNVATWSGNLAIKRAHQDFPSDVLVVLESVGAKLNVVDFNQGEKAGYLVMDLIDYLGADKLGNHLIESMNLPSFDQSKARVKAFKTSQRSQNSHSYVNCGLRFELDSDLKVTSQPVLIFNGISPTFNRATKTEKFLENRDLSDEKVFKEAVEILVDELNSSGINDINDVLLPSAKYRVNLAVSYFYKFVVSTVSKSKKNVSNEAKSAAESVIDSRETSRSEQKFPSKSDLFPLTKPMPKMNAYPQTTGETKYVGDVHFAHQLNGVFIKSTVANAKIDSVDFSEALKMPGVVQILLAKDIPGENSITNNPLSVGAEQLFADGVVEYYGQPIGLIVARTELEAREATKLVKVTYSDVKKPILTIDDAINENAFASHPYLADLTKGDAKTAIENSKHQIDGEFRLDSSQFNFYLEGLVAFCEPTDDGFKVESSTQWVDAVHRCVTGILGLKNSSSVDVQVKQIGGGFGGKATRGNFPAAAAAVAANSLNVPVKVHMDLNDCMDIVGRRPSWYVKYRAGFDDTGKLNGVEYEWYTDVGVAASGSLLCIVYSHFESAYKCDNYTIKPRLLKTNRPACVEVRSPDIYPSICVQENLIQHVAEFLGREPLEVREVNFFKPGDLTAAGHELKHLDVEGIVKELKETSEYLKRKRDVEQFNKENRYKKRGIAFQPMRYAITHSFGYYNILISVRSDDGSVAVSHGGIEMGQGMHTKAAQVCAQQLGIPFELVSVKATNSLVNPNGMITGGSITSEMICKGIIGACGTLKEMLEPVRKQMPSESYTWKELIQKALKMKLNLSVMYLSKAEDSKDITLYDVDAAACSEVLIDVLTGEIQVLRTDILYDCGQSINGLIDLGQAEGAFLMGLGYVLLEKSIYNPETGKCLNNGTWEYKPPMAGDIPVDFRVRLAENKTNVVGVLGSKAVGEPPLILSTSLLLAIRHAIAAARADRGLTGHFRFDLPATVDNVQSACSIDFNQLKF